MRGGERGREREVGREREREKERGGVREFKKNIKFMVHILNFICGELTCRSHRPPCTACTDTV